MTLIEIKSHRRGWKVFEAPALSLCSRKKLSRLTMRRTAQAFAQAKFGFSIQATLWSALSNLRKRIEDCDGGHCASITAEGVLPTPSEDGKDPSAASIRAFMALVLW